MKPWPLGKLFEGVEPEDFISSSEARRRYFEKQEEEDREE